MTEVNEMAGRLAETHREIGRRDADGGTVHSILMRRRYAAPVEDVWEACTTPDRLARFFIRPEGDLRAGGTFRFEGNASGEILRCEPPRLLRITWVYGEPTGDEVELRLAPGKSGETDETVLELEHTSPTRLTDFLLNDPKAGIWGLGAGWELSLLALDSHLAGTFPDVDPGTLAESPELADLANRCSDAWAAVLAATRP
jgi:uncharacterized protein YndB with AHSA1/START domain